MIKNNNARILVGAMNILAVGLPALTTEAYAVAGADTKMESLNSASLKSIEGTWLKVAAACKARGFNADPVALTSTAQSEAVQDIYSSFGV